MAAFPFEHYATSMNGRHLIIRCLKIEALHNTPNTYQFPKSKWRHESLHSYPMQNTKQKLHKYYSM